jgi:hypothetical protein
LPLSLHFRIERAAGEREPFKARAAEICCFLFANVVFGKLSSLLTVKTLAGMTFFNHKNVGFHGNKKQKKVRHTRAHPTATTYPLHCADHIMAAMGATRLRRR